jgi:pyruvate-ferredoxin/flavodoxin oxidoreductase
MRALEGLKSSNSEAYEAVKTTILHAIMGFGGTDKADTMERIANEYNGKDDELIKAMVHVLRQDAYNHKDVQTIEGTMPNGMCVMAMTANTGCNSVYGSTPPNNPHTYPWMNSLFQDGATIGWLVAESFIQNHSRRSVIPERITDFLLDGKGNFTEETYFRYTHFTDAYMTDQEILELPKVWAIGGDGALGDIGFQNLSKVVCQNRPNMKILMLNTQVYSNTGGQNSDMSVMPGGFDMNQYGPATEGKLTEQKSPAEAFTGGHGSPFVAQVSMAASASLYKAVMDALVYRGVGYIQAYTPCMPEHGIADERAAAQAKLAKESRGLPEFIFDSSLGESFTDTLSLKGNLMVESDWAQKVIPGTKEKYEVLPVHWACTEPRFRQHIKKSTKENCEGMTLLNDKIKLISMNDVMHRRYLDESHRAFVPEKGIYFVDYKEDGSPVYYVVSRQMVLFCVERRKAWRMLQSRAGVANNDYAAQREMLKSIDAGELTVEEALKS